MKRPEEPLSKWPSGKDSENPEEIHHSQVIQATQKTKVCVRCRGLNGREETIRQDVNAKRS